LLLLLLLVLVLLLAARPLAATHKPEPAPRSFVFYETQGSHYTL
jgi:hypothetical protein